MLQLEEKEGDEEEVERVEDEEEDGDDDEATRTGLQQYLQPPIPLESVEGGGGDALPIDACLHVHSLPLHGEINTDMATEIDNDTCQPVQPWTQTSATSMQTDDCITRMRPRGVHMYLCTCAHPWSGSVPIPALSAGWDQICPHGVECHILRKSELSCRLGFKSTRLTHPNPAPKQALNQA